MQYSNFSRLEEGLTIKLYNSVPIENVLEIKYFNDKVNTLNTKLKSIFNIKLLQIAMILVIALEILGPIIILLRILLGKKSPVILNILTNIVFVLFILFLVVVTLIYHPFSLEKSIPFLSNCSTLSGLIFLFIISNSNLI